MIYFCLRKQTVIPREKVYKYCWTARNKRGRCDKVAFFANQGRLNKYLYANTRNKGRQGKGRRSSMGSARKKVLR